MDTAFVLVAGRAASGKSSNHRSTIAITPTQVVRMGVVVVIAIVILIGAGFWFTRNARGPRGLSAESRAVDVEGRYGPTGDRVPRADDELSDPDKH